MDLDQVSESRSCVPWLLTEKQELELCALEEASFSRLCKQLGCSPQQRQEVLFAAFQRKLAALPTGDPIRGLLDHGFSPERFWKVFRRLVRSNKAMAVEEMVEVAPQLPINYTYLRSLAANIGITEPASGDGASLRAFLYSIPEVSLFDIAFNAFVRQGGEIDGIPYVCVYEQLISSVEGFSDIVVPLVIAQRRNGTIDPAEEAEVLARSAEASFMRTCRSALGMVFGESDRAIADSRSHVLSLQSADGELLHQLVLSGAVDFVRYHEYGHLMMGHLSSEPCPRLEFEADHFARWAVALTYRDVESAYSWRLLGAVLCLVLLTIIEKRSGEETGTTHPPADERLRVFLRSLGSAEGTYTRFGRAILAATRPTLKKCWGCEVTLDG